MKYKVRSMVLCSLFVMSIFCCCSMSEAQTDKAKESAPPATTPAAPVAAPAPVSEGTASDAFYLAEKKYLESAPKELKDFPAKRLIRRQPRFFKELNLTEEQNKKMAAVQEKYHSIISILQLRLIRLNEERTAAYQSILTPEQQTKLKQLEEAAINSNKTSKTKTSAK